MSESQHNKAEDKQALKEKHDRTKTLLAAEERAQRARDVALRDKNSAKVDKERATQEEKATKLRHGFQEEMEHMEKDHVLVPQTHMVDRLLDEMDDSFAGTKVDIPALRKYLAKTAKRVQKGTTLHKILLPIPPKVKLLSSLTNRREHGSPVSLEECLFYAYVVRSSHLLEDPKLQERIGDLKLIDCLRDCLNQLALNKPDDQDYEILQDLILDSVYFMLFKKKWCDR